MAVTAFPQTNAARIFRIVYSEGQPADSVTMFSSRTNLASSESILRYLTNDATRLTERDVVILQVEPSVSERSLRRFETPFGLLEREVHDCVSTNNIKDVHLNYDLRFFAQEGNGFYDKERPNRK